MAQITLNSTGVASDGALALQSNGTTTAVTISTAQNVGIGTASPARLLSLSAASPILRMTETGANSDLDFIVSTNSGGLNISVDANNEGANSFCAVSVDGSERMRIDSSGNVGIGTNSPGAKLDVSSGAVRLSNAYQVQWFNGATQLASILADTSPNLTFQTGSSNTERMRIDSSGNLLVGATTADSGSRVRIVGASSTSADYALVVDRASGADILGCRNDGYVVVSSLAGSGNRAVYSDASGGLSNSASDRNLKEDDKEVTQGLPEVLAMRPVNFKWIDEDRFGKQREIGFIAQEMLELVPEVIGENSDGSFSLDYPKLVPVLVKAIQEQQAIIQTLTDRITALEAK